jgi:REP element-mobilizing transposase RayT
LMKRILYLMITPGNPRLQPAEIVGWHSRGYLPHFDSHEVVQHATFHLADSLPSSVLVHIKEDLRLLPAERRGAVRRKRMEAWIDAGHGSCLLREREAARLMQNALLRFDGVRYRLLAWVVMPNHVHALFQVMEYWALSRVIASWKSFTGRRLALLMPPSPEQAGVSRIWHREYWDRYIRDENHFMAARKYIHDNPVKAGFVRYPEEWEWSSARLLGAPGSSLAKRKVPFPMEQPL